MTREERAVYQREWRKRNLEKSKGYYRARKDKHIAYQRAWAERNPDKIVAADKKFRQNNPHRVKEILAKSRSHRSDAQKLLTQAFHRIHRMGLTLNQYLDLLIQQDFRCGLCGGLPVDSHPKRKSPDGFVIDHDHATGRVRGLLHPNCNAGIGLLQDSPEILRRGAEYLERC